jgi:hypothetical protein
MPNTTGNFQDLVQLSADTFYHLGEALSVGNPSASTVSFGFSNSGGQALLAAAQTTNQTIWLPSNSSGNQTLLTNWNLSAGTTSNNLSALTLSNSNNVSFGLNGSVVTASATVASSQGSINVSAGTTSNNVSAVTFGNGSNVSFGLSTGAGIGTITASVASSLTNINVSAGTTSNNLSAITFANSNGVSFGLSTGAGIGTITASVAAGAASINVSAGTTSNNLTNIVFSNSNGISFGLSGSTITAQNGGMSSWSNGDPVTALTGGQNTLFFQPLLIPYNITVTNLLWLASVSNHATNSSGGLSVSAALYTLNGGTALSLASSGSTNLTWTSGAALSSNTGINYQQMSVNSWGITPGPYLFAWWVSTQNSATMSYYGNAAQPLIGSGQIAAMSNLMLMGYSQATTNGLPTSFGLSNTASYIRTGATAAEQPYIIMQGT